ncbi:hypothetical protein GN956_G19326 [Arapaima gigas]
MGSFSCFSTCDIVSEMSGEVRPEVEAPCPCGTVGGTPHFAVGRRNRLRPHQAVWEGCRDASRMDGLQGANCRVGIVSAAFVCQLVSPTAWLRRADGSWGGVGTKRPPGNLTISNVSHRATQGAPSLCPHDPVSPTQIGTISNGAGYLL